jgi:hypothetical protein
MGHSTSTRTHTHVKPVPVLVGMGTGGYGYGYRRVTRVRKPAWVCTAGLHQPPSISFGFASFDLHPRSTLQAVARRHWGGCCAVQCRCGGMWLSAPGPPCEQVLAVVGDRCWGTVFLLPQGSALQRSKAVEELCSSTEDVEIRGEEVVERRMLTPSPPLPHRPA